MQDPHNLDVYEHALDMAVAVYRLTAKYPREEAYGITSQMRRAAVSVGCNIAEGCGRTGDRQYLQFLDISMGSATELTFLFDLSGRLELGEAALMETAKAEHLTVRRMTAALIRAVRARVE
ncbi:MAG: ribosomal protein [Gemmatimonadetes bacterium]|nr:ribosomal protein [Gemmatimonadota bacterium]